MTVKAGYIGKAVKRLRASGRIGLAKGFDRHGGTVGKGKGLRRSARRTLAKLKGNGARRTWTERRTVQRARRGSLKG